MDTTRYRQDAPLASPCIRHCCLDQHDICLGCFRSLAEITSWTQVDDKTRQRFLENALKRKCCYQQKLLEHSS